MFASAERIPRVAFLLRALSSVRFVFADQTALSPEIYASVLFTLPGSRAGGNGFPYLDSRFE